MDSMIAKLRVALQLETAAFEKGTRRAAAEVDAFGTRAEKLGLKIGRMGKAVIAAGGAFAAAGIAVALKDMVAEGLEYASSLGETAQKLGVSTKALQEYRYAASQVGIEQEAMDKGLAKLTKSLGDAANGSKAQEQAFAALGVNIRDVNGNVRDAGDIIPEMAEGLLRFGSEAEKASVLSKILGKSWSEWMPLLANGSRGVNQLRDDANKLGLVIDKTLIDDADDAADKMGSLNRVLQAQIAQAVAANAKEIANLVTKLIDLVTWSVRALNSWSNLTTAMDKKAQAVIDGRKAIDARSDLTPQQKSDAKKALPGQIDQRLGITKKKATTGFGGFYNSVVPGFLGTIYEAEVKDPKTKFAGGGLALTNSWLTRPLKPGLGMGGGAFGAMIDAPASPEVQAKLAAISKQLADARVASMVEKIRAQIEGVYRDGAPAPAGPRSAESISDALAKKLQGNRFEQVQNALQDKWRELSQGAEVTKVSVVESFADMAQGTIDSLQRMTSAFQNGDFLSKLSAILGLVTQLGSIGLFGKNIQAKLNSPVPAYAGGTGFHPGGLALVGEKGPELVNLPRGAAVYPHGTGPGGGNVYNIRGNLLTPEFWAQINRGDAMAAQAGSQLAIRKSAYRNSRRLA